jgi:hypothetical protein
MINFTTWAGEITDDPALICRIAQELEAAYLLGYKKRGITDDQISTAINLLGESCYE